MKKLRIAIILIVTCFACFWLLDLLFPLDTNKLHRPQSAVFYDNDGKLLNIHRSSDGFFRFHATNNEIPKNLKKSVLLFEDKWFYYHFGINPISIIRASFNNLSGKRTIGASTITMQVARMMHKKKRTILNKIIEMFNALQLEWHYSKDEILQMYLNLAPYGGNIEGVKTAAWFYFKNSLPNLSLSQIALLTTIPQNPNKNRLDRQKNIIKKRNHIINIMHKNNLIDNSQKKRAKLEPIRSRRYKIPLKAKHFCLRLNKEGKVQTNLDLALQEFVQQSLFIALDKLHDKNVKNASAIVIDNENMHTKAYLGSHSFKADDGQNDGLKMIRNVGSTLKPFIYALALDDGIITPKRIVYDLPISIKEYSPKNYNKHFFGQITAQNALSLSLNIPFVRLNMFLGKNSLYELLQKAQISSVDKKKQYYSNAIALGSVSISPLDIAHLYTSLANGGVLKPLDLKDNNQTIRLFSPQAAWLTTKALQESTRPEMSSSWEFAKNSFFLAFKTGTSAKHIDLYTIGFSKQYTVAVWMGNFDASPTKHLSGLQTASKVVLAIFRYLNDVDPLTNFYQPQGLHEKTICADAIKRKKCKNFVLDYVIDKSTPKNHCGVLTKEVFAYLKSTNKLSSISELFFNPCYEKWKKQKPILSSPYDGTDLSLPRKELFQKVLVKCYSFKKDEKIYYWVDDGDLISAKSGEDYFVKIPLGSHVINCLDSSSSLTKSRIFIKEE